MWRASPPGQVPDLDGLRQDRARELVASFLAEPSRGGWLPQDTVAELLGCYGVRLADSIEVTTEQAARSPRRPGSPVRSRSGRRARPAAHRRRPRRAHRTARRRSGPARVRPLAEDFGGRLAGIIVQPVVAGGVEVAISVLHEQVGGPAGAVGPAAPTMCWLPAPPGSPPSPTLTPTT